MKAASEGSEIQLTWPATVPTAAGKIEQVSAERIVTLLSGGRRQTYRLRRKEFSLVPHLLEGEVFGAGDTIIASVLPTLVKPAVPVRPQYDYVRDLDDSENETVYAAVKALGFLPELAEKAVGRLESVAGAGDVRIRLEAAASLARLGSESGWQRLEVVARDEKALPEHRMEVVLILGELPSERAAGLLDEIANRRTNHSELRAAAAWSLAAMPQNQPQSVLRYVSDDDEVIAVHAIVAGSRLITEENLETVLADVGTDRRQSAGIVRAVLRSTCSVVPTVVRLLKTAAGDRQSWLLYLLASKGREVCEEYLRAHAPDVMSRLEFFWLYQVENWTNRLDVADQIDFLAQQNIR